jgi:hypothetical protein
VAEIGWGSPSEGTDATEGVAPAASSLAIGVDLCGNLEDLEIGPREVTAPKRSSRGEER